MRTSKKGIGWEWYGLILAFVLGIAAYYVDFYFAPHKIIDNYIGQYQFSIIKANNQAEKSLLYIDQSTKYSLEQSIYELAQNGGISEYDKYDFFLEHECGKFNDAYIWYRLGKDANDDIEIEDCFDEELAIYNVEYYFYRNFKKYLEIYPHNIIEDNYDYEIKDGLEVIGRARNPLIFHILKDETKPALIEPTKTKEGLVDFTGTELCAKGKICLLREEAFEKLKKAQQRAEEKGVSLEVYDGYRNREQLIQEWENGRFSHIKDEQIRKQYVCYPYGDDVEKRCPHATGKAVDARIKGKDDLVLLKKIMTEDRLEDRWIRYAKEHEEHHFECCGTLRYARAKELEEKTGQTVTEIV